VSRFPGRNPEVLPLQSRASSLLRDRLPRIAIIISFIAIRIGREPADCVATGSTAGVCPIGADRGAVTILRSGRMSRPWRMHTNTMAFAATLAHERRCGSRVSRGCRCRPDGTGDGRPLPRHRAARSPRLVATERPAGQAGPPTRIPRRGLGGAVGHGRPAKRALRRRPPCGFAHRVGQGRAVQRGVSVRGRRRPIAGTTPVSRFLNRNPIK
jgi:hypothetical protein